MCDEWMNSFMQIYVVWFQWLLKEIQCYAACAFMHSDCDMHMNSDCDSVHLWYLYSWHIAFMQSAIQRGRPRKNGAPPMPRLLINSTQPNRKRGRPSKVVGENVPRGMGVYYGADDRIYINVSMTLLLLYKMCFSYVIALTCLSDLSSSMDFRAPLYCRKEMMLLDHLSQRRLHNLDICSLRKWQLLFFCLDMFCTLQQAKPWVYLSFWLSSSLLCHVTQKPQTCCGIAC